MVVEHHREGGVVEGTARDGCAEQVGDVAAFRSDESVADVGRSLEGGVSNAFAGGPDQVRIARTGAGPAKIARLEEAFASRGALEVGLSARTVAEREDGDSPAAAGGLRDLLDELLSEELVPGIGEVVRIDTVAQAWIGAVG